MKKIHLDILRTLSAEDPETAKYFNSSLCTYKEKSLAYKLKLYQEIIDWVILNGRYPNQNSKNKSERRYAYQLSGYKHSLNGIRVTRCKTHPEITQLFIDQKVEYLLEVKTLLEKRLEIYQEVIDWIIDHDGVSPSYYIEEEKKNACRITSCRRELRSKNKNFSAVKQLFIDNNLGYIIMDDIIDPKIIKLHQEIIDWVILNGRPPSHCSKNKSESRYAYKLSVYRQSLKDNGRVKTYPEVNQLYIDSGMEYLLKCNPKQTLDDRLKLFQEIIDWAIVNGRPPRNSSTDKIENRYANIIQAYRYTLKRNRPRKGSKGCKIYPEVTQLFIDQNVEYLLEYNVYKGVIDRLKLHQEIIDWAIVNGRPPHRITERKYYYVLDGYKKGLRGSSGHKAYTEITQLYIDQNVEYLIDIRTKKEKRIEKYQTIIEWCKHNNKPTKSSKGIAKKYANALDAYRQKLKHGNGTSEVTQLFIDQQAEWVINTRTFDIKDYVK